MVTTFLSHVSHDVLEDMGLTSMSWININCRDFRRGYLELPDRAVVIEIECVCGRDRCRMPDYPMSSSHVNLTVWVLNESLDGHKAKNMFPPESWYHYDCATGTAVLVQRANFENRGIEKAELEQRITALQRQLANYSCPNLGNPSR